MFSPSRHRGFVLIFALWVLGFLTVLAVGVAAGIRQKIVLLEKLDQRSHVQHLLEASVKYAAGYIGSQRSLAGESFKSSLKMNLHNNPQIFGQFDLGDSSASISYQGSDQSEVYGVIDEERKININTVNVAVLSRLIEKAINVKSDQARRLAESILDWRQFGESQAKGFFSDGYYSNLEYPYAKKDADYESLDELLLVKDITKEIYDQLIKFVTIYGNGRVNINTASREVLYALGFDDVLIDKIFEVRSGRDAQEATLDDHIFLKTYDIATEVNTVVKLLPEEIHQIDAINKQDLLTTNSFYYSIKSAVHLAHSSFSKEIRAIYSFKENKIVYWKER